MDIVGSECFRVKCNSIESNWGHNGTPQWKEVLLPLSSWMLEEDKCGGNCTHGVIFVSSQEVFKVLDQIRCLKLKALYQAGIIQKDTYPSGTYVNPGKYTYAFVGWKPYGYDHYVVYKVTRHSTKDHNDICADYQHNIKWLFAPDYTGEFNKVEV